MPSSVPVFLIREPCVAVVRANTPQDAAVILRTRTGVEVGAHEFVNLISDLEPGRAMLLTVPAQEAGEIAEALAVDGAAEAVLNEIDRDLAGDYEDLNPETENDDDDQRLVGV